MFDAGDFFLSSADHKQRVIKTWKLLTCVNERYNLETDSDTTKRGQRKITFFVYFP
jgi:hypothetical protein